MCRSGGGRLVKEGPYLSSTTQKDRDTANPSTDQSDYVTKGL